MKRLFILFLLTAIGPFFSFSARADSCVCDNLSDETLYEQASAVFSAKSITATETANNALWNTFVITHIEKADKNSQLLIDSYEINGEKKAKIAQKISDCNFIFNEGREYKIYATQKITQKGKPYFTTAQCTGTKEITVPEDSKKDELTPASGESVTIENQEKIAPEGQNAQKN